MRCEVCCLEKPDDGEVDFTALARKLGECTECPHRHGESANPVVLLQVERIQQAAKRLRHKKNKIRRLEHDLAEQMREIEQADARVAKLEQTQRASTQAADERLRAQVVRLEQQHEAILALSTPIIQVWEGVLVLPLIGVLDEARLTRMTENLLVALQEKQAQTVVLDLTGISEIDDTSVELLLRVAKAVRLLGSVPLLCGMRPNVARMVVNLGLNLGELAVSRTLQQTLTQCMMSESGTTRNPKRNRSGLRA